MWVKFWCQAADTLLTSEMLAALILSDMLLMLSVVANKSHERS